MDFSRNQIGRNYSVCWYYPIRRPTTLAEIARNLYSFLLLPVVFTSQQKLRSILHPGKSWWVGGGTSSNFQSVISYQVGLCNFRLPWSHQSTPTKSETPTPTRLKGQRPKRGALGIGKNSLVYMFTFFKVITVRPWTIEGEGSQGQGGLFSGARPTWTDDLSVHSLTR